MIRSDIRDVKRQLFVKQRMFSSVFRYANFGPVALDLSKIAKQTKKCKQGDANLQLGLIKIIK